ncbi:DUF262 domain-containing protein [Natronolimnohabitans sp. A-GB9]|uniref:DUF262 domain-containing protein n=1 Tax=Natronolimnohabitans sp. A-GB9 TaxID=3069757 RepID=UPI0027B811FD|nr:DUF262 domain-containing protein [Natronolimnohabitans sp. A-GB9]MDQ2052056.1 DUF262 domain-containing protein [Natronolimnohabitans sp. A-GB9]
MGYQSTTIDSIIKDINHSYLIPAIQREFVWEKTQILDLFDSVLRGYPIGSFLFWKVSDEYAQERVKYKFVENYIEDPIYPDEFSDVNYHNIRYHDEFGERLPKRVNLVLDGQQRLTSFYIGLKGTYTEKKPNKRRKRKESWDRKQLYLNVLSPTNEEENDRRYQFEFKKPNPEISKGEYWYRVGDILNVNDSTEEAERILSEIEETDKINTETARGPVTKNIHHLYRAIRERDAISYFEEDEENQNKVLDIFIRANEGGTQLKKSDILLSIATAHWRDEESNRDIVAREEIQELVDRMNEHDARGGTEFDSNFVLRALMLTGEVSNLSFSLSNFNKTTLSKMKDAWTDPKFETSIFRTLDLMNSFGFTTSHVRSKMILLPIIYYFYHNNNPTLSFNSNMGKENRKKLLYWTSSMVTTGDLTTAGTTQTVQGVRKVIKGTPGNEFPLQEVESKLNDYNKSMGVDEETIERWFREGNNSNRVLQVVLSLLYFPDVANENYNYELDHIFPKSKLEKEYLLSETDLSREKVERLDEFRDSLANLQLLRKGENRTKSSKLPEEWLPTRTRDYLTRHCIPKDPDLYKLENADQFFERRKELIVKDLLEKSPNRSTISPDSAKTEISR